jgi:hypothetical protein
LFRRAPRIPGRAAAIILPVVPPESATLICNYKVGPVIGGIGDQAGRPEIEDFFLPLLCGAEVSESVNLQPFSFVLFSRVDDDDPVAPEFCSLVWDLGRWNYHLSVEIGMLFFFFGGKL